MTHAQRAEYLRALGAGLAARADDIGQIWPRESGVTPPIAHARGDAVRGDLRFLCRAGRHLRRGSRRPSRAGPAFGLLVREPVGVVGAIIPWNGPLGLISYKIAPALIAGCTVILKSSPEAPGKATSWPRWPRRSACPRA